MDLPVGIKDDTQANVDWPMPSTMGKQGYDRVTKEVLSWTVVRDRYILGLAGTESIIPLKTTYRFVYT